MSCAFARHSLRKPISDELCHANHALRNQQAGCADVGPKRIRGTADRVAPSHCDPLVRSFLFHLIGGGGAAVREASAAAELIMISRRPPLRSTPHVERRRLIRISGNCRRPTAEGGERIVNHAAVEGFFVVPFNLWLRLRATVRKYSERERVPRRFDILCRPRLEPWPQISKPRTNFLYIRAFCFPVAAALWFCARPTVPHMKQGLKQMRKAGSKKSRAQQVMLDFN